MKRMAQLVGATLVHRSDLQRNQSRARAYGSWTRIRLFAFVLLLGVASAAQAGEFCSSYPGGVIDGNDPLTVATLPSAITIDTDCTFQNWNPLNVTVNFQTNDPSIYLIVFDNVVFTGNMACASVEHKIWFSNSDYGSNNSCQDLFIPVETIANQAPASTASIGVPFTYTLTLPSMNLGGGPSANDLHSVVLWDDLTATGVDLTFVDIKAYYKSDPSVPVTLVPEDRPQGPDPVLNSKGGPWTPKNLSYKPFPSSPGVIPAGEQLVVEITVVLDDTPTNVAGKEFVNTAKWWFGRAIDLDEDGVIEDDEFFDPLPGEWGISAPMTIAEPNLIVNKTSPETALNLGVRAPFTIDVQNTGGSDAWKATILDRLPNNPVPADGGMCDYDPRTALSAKIVQADGTTLVRNLAPITDYTVSYTGPAGTPACELSFTLTEAGGPIAPNQRLIITYESELDSDTTTDGVELTNVAGAVEWFSGPNALTARQYSRTVTDGTPSIVDHQDSHTITTALAGYYFQKTVVNRTSLENPATTATPGDMLRYKLRLFNISEVIDGITITDVLDPTKFDLATFVMVTDLAAMGAKYTFNPSTGLLTVSGDAAPLNLVPPTDIVIEFDITLKSTLASGTAVDNQAKLTANNGAINAYSDDPYVNGVAAPDDPADPTTIIIVGPDRLTLDKSGPADMGPDVPGTFTLDVHNAGTGAAWDVTVTDLLPNPTPGGMCDAAPTNVTAQMYQADGVTPVGGALVAGTDFTVDFAGAPSCTFTITMQSAAGAIPANHRLIITYQALLDADNVNGVPITNVAGATRWYSADPAPGTNPKVYTRVLTNGTVGTVDHEDAHTVNPVIPLNGIVYDSVTRRPIAGATITMLRASTGQALPAACFADPAQQNQSTNAYGHYSLELNFTQPECPPDADYVIAVTAAPAAYDVSAPSRIIPPTTSTATAAYSVPACPADAIPSTTDRCEAQSSSGVPTGASPATYYLHLTLSNNVVDNAVTPPTTTDINNQIFNNHIPLDPKIDAAVAITKNSALTNVTRGQMILYTITVKNTMGGTLQDLTIIDTVPLGFKYVEGSSRFDGKSIEPKVDGHQLRWENLTLVYNKTHTIKLLLVASSGLAEGEYVNQAQVVSSVLGGPASPIATATVRLVPDPTSECTDIIGKVYDDANANGYQDNGETGLLGARVVSARGLIARTDERGRFHITCAAIPNEDRGSNFILKLDDRSLPSGYRVTTENPLVERLTRGKMAKFNFGATIHRVVRLDIADGVFEEDSTEMRPQWVSRIDLLLQELRKGPAILRLSYLADVEDAGLVIERVDAIKQEISNRWARLNCCYVLKTETEIFWRRGGPPERRLRD